MFPVSTILANKIPIGPLQYVAADNKVNEFIQSKQTQPVEKLRQEITYEKTSQKMQLGVSIDIPEIFTLNMEHDIKYNTRFLQFAELNHINKHYGNNKNDVAGYQTRTILEDMNNLELPLQSIPPTWQKQNTNNYIILQRPTEDGKYIKSESK